MKIFNYTIVIAVIFFFSVDLRTQMPFEKTEEMLNMNNAGTEFLFTFHPGWGEIEGTVDIISVYVSSNVETAVKLEIPAIGYKEVKRTTANEITHFYLSPEQALAYTKTDREPPLPVQIFEKRAIMLTSQDPVVCYAVLRYQYTSDGYLVLPTHVLGREYVVASVMDPVNAAEFRFQWLTSYTSIVGVDDNTEVNFLVGGNSRTWIPINTVKKEDGIPSGGSLNKIINKGDILIIPGMGEAYDLTGSYIQSDKPVAVFSGSFCAYIPYSVAACDYIIAQEYPIENWGNTFHVTPIINREKNSYISIFAREDNTIIYRNGVKWTTIEKGKGGTSELKGYFQGRVSAMNTPVAAFTLSSDPDKPISITQYNNGFQDDKIDADPFQMSLIPTEHYNKFIYMNTPGIADTFSFKNNFVNIIYLANEDGSIPDDLQLGRFIDGNLHWEQVNSLSSDNEFQLYTSDRSDNRSYFVKQLHLSWGDGVYLFKANDSIAVYSYGGGDYDSYGTPAASFVKDRQSGDIVPPKIELLSANSDFSEISLYIQDLTNTTIVSGLSTIMFPSEVHSNYTYEIEDFAIGKQDCKVHLKVDDYTKAAQSGIFAIDRAGNHSTQIYNYQPINLPTLINPDTDFGLVRVGEEITKNLILSNLNDETTLEIKDLQIINNEANLFDLTYDTNFPIILETGEEIPLTLKFKSNEEGFYQSRLILETTEAEYPFGYLKAETSQPYIEVTDFDFGSVREHTTVSKRIITITNKGRFELKISNIEIIGSDVFELILDSEVTEENPLIIAPIGQIQIRIKTNTSKPGIHTTQIRFVSDGKVIKDIANLSIEVMTTSVSDNTQQGITLMQNSEQIYFESSENPLIEKIEIYTMDGKKVFESRNRINVNELRYDTRNLQKGVYFVALNIKNRLVSFKFMVNE